MAFDLSVLTQHLVGRGWAAPCSTVPVMTALWLQESILPSAPAGESEIDVFRGLVHQRQQRGRYINVFGLIVAVLGYIALELHSLGGMQAASGWISGVRKQVGGWFFETAAVPYARGVSVPLNRGAELGSGLDVALAESWRAKLHFWPLCPSAIARELPIWCLLGVRRA